MKWLFLLVIKLYWALVPVNNRRGCLFKETCSQHVYRHAYEEGFIKGALALMQRLKKCRKGYQLYSGAKGFEMELADGSVINEEEISLSLLEPIYKSVKKIGDQQPL